MFSDVNQVCPATWVHSLSQWGGYLRNPVTVTVAKLRNLYSYQ